jgi:hypothetical protein
MALLIAKKDALSTESVLKRDGEKRTNDSEPMQQVRAIIA